MSHSSILNHFEEDQLNRKPLADYLTSFIKTAIPTTNEKSVVIALDSPWGSGKSSFINMWTNSLNNEEFVYVNYNAWENDDFEDALTPIICCLWEKTDRTVDADCLQIIKTFGKNFLGQMIQLCNKEIQSIIGIDPGKLVTDTYNDVKRGDSEIFESYILRQKEKSLFSKLIDNIRKVRDVENGQKKVIICIDELDRCRPTFAIETLEIIKHFFDINNLIFVFSLDMNQLKKTIQIIYGEIECTAYLQRFFDYQLTFTKPNLRDYLSSRLVDANGRQILDIKFAIDAAEFFSLSLRTLNVICEEFRNFISKKLTLTKRSTHGPDDLFKKTYFVFFCMKYSNPVEYYNCINDGIPERPGNKFWNDCFLYGEGSNIPESWYPKKFANMELSELWNETNSKYENTLRSVALKHLIYDDELETVDSDVFKVPLKQIIKNNIEYDVMFPEQTDFIIKPANKNKQLP